MINGLPAVPVIGFASSGLAIFLPLCLLKIDVVSIFGNSMIVCTQTITVRIVERVPHACLILPFRERGRQHREEPR